MRDLALYSGVLGLLLSIVAITASLADRRHQRRNRRRP